MKEGASAGFPLSCFTMGKQILAKAPESYTASDVVNATDWFEKAAKGGVVSANVAHARLLSGTIPMTEADIPKMIELLNSAANAEDAEAKYLLSEIYSTGKPEYATKDVGRATQLLEDSASEGWAEAQFRLGNEYAGYDDKMALGTFSKDFGEARQWFELSAAQGNSSAQKSLCRMNEFGDGGPTNLATARAICENAAENNLAWAFVKKGNWYSNGTIYAQNHELAVQNFRIAAEMHDSEGCYFLGEMYWKALGMDPATTASLKAAGLTAQQIAASFHPIALFWFIRAELYGGDARATTRLKEFKKYYECFENSGNQALYIVTRNANPPVDYEYVRPNDIIESFRRDRADKNPAEYHKLLEILGLQIKATLRQMNPNRVSLIEGTTAGEKRTFANDITFCWCPPGKFSMGAPATTDGESSVEVTLTSGFWLSETEVTQSQWQQVMESSPWSGNRHVKEGADYPAVYISHKNAVSFCEKITAQEQKSERVPGGWKFALPTEAQWEYACRAGATTTFSFGDDESQLGRFAWFANNTTDYPERVGQKRANEWGLKDMHGNVCEWCADWYLEPLSGGQNPSGPSSSELLKSRARVEEGFGFTIGPPKQPAVRSPMRVFRGGSWDSGANRCHSAYRNADDDVVRYYFIGCRLALVPE